MLLIIFIPGAYNWSNLNIVVLDRMIAMKTSFVVPTQIDWLALLFTTIKNSGFVGQVNAW